MSDLCLDSKTHDLVIKDGDFSLTTGNDTIRQRIKQALLFYKGEWFLDVTAGIPYFDDVLIKSPEQKRVESIFKAAILAVEGTVKLLEFKTNYVPDTRTFELDFVVETNVGNVSLEVSV